MNRTLAIAMLVTCVAPAWLRGQNPPRPQAPARATGPRPRECNVTTQGVYFAGVLTSHAESFATGPSQHNTFYGGGVDARGAGTHQRLLWDSAEHDGAQKMLIFINHVHYTEARVKLDADRITYYTAEERLVAEGNVHGVTNTGTTFTGPRATYFRAVRGVRDRSKLDADGRPDLWLSPKDAGNGAKDSVNLKADHVISDNDEIFYAKGKVIIERPDLHATADSAHMDNVKEIVRLRQEPKIEGRGERKFTLEGDLIDIFSKNREVERVKSAGKGKATSDDVTLTADTIDLRVANQKLDRAYAWGPKRAKAHSKDNDITADSIDVLMPGQVVREMRALRSALAETPPDSTKITSHKMDWLRGDTVIAQFDSIAPGDTVNKPAIKQIVASGRRWCRRRPTTSSPQWGPANGQAERQLQPRQQDRREVRRRQSRQRPRRRARYGLLRRGIAGQRLDGGARFERRRKGAREENHSCQKKTVTPNGPEGMQEQLRALVEQYADGDRPAALALLALLGVADETGTAGFQEVSVRWRSDYLATLRAEGRDADAEAGRLGLDEVRDHLTQVTLPRLVAAAAVVTEPDGTGHGLRIPASPRHYGKRRGRCGTG